MSGRRVGGSAGESESSIRAITPTAAGQYMCQTDAVAPSLYMRHNRVASLRRRLEGGVLAGAGAGDLDLEPCALCRGEVAHSALRLVSVRNLQMAPQPHRSERCRPSVISSNEKGKNDGEKRLSSATATATSP